MWVALTSFTPEPERTVAAAAKLSTSQLSAAELKETLTPVQIDKLLSHLISAGHLSPFEHASFTFVIDGISRACSHQLVRHRLASYTQQSQRYVALKSLEYVTPPTIAAKADLKAKYNDMVQQAHKLYTEMVDAGVPAEDARYVLPNAMETKIVMSMNARELMHACSLRLCLKAQWEIVDLFQRIKEEVQKVAPRLGDELQPKCFALGYCNERESCGLFPTLKEIKGGVSTSAQ